VKEYLECIGKGNEDCGVGHLKAKVNITAVNKPQEKQENSEDNKNSSKSLRES